MTYEYPSLAVLNEQIAHLVAQTKALKEQTKQLREQDKSTAVAEIKAVLARFPGIKLTATELGIAKPKNSGKPRVARKVFHDPIKDRNWAEGSRPMPKWVKDAEPESLVVSIIEP